MARLRSRLETEGGVPLAPFIDVVFLLVIFFMVNATFAVRASIEVDLPLSRSSSAPAPGQMTVTVTDDGSVFIEDSVVPVEDLPARLRATAASQAIERVVIRADSELPFRVLVQVMDAIRLAGISAISLLTVPDPTGSSGS